MTGDLSRRLVGEESAVREALRGGRRAEAEARVRSLVLTHPAEPQAWALDSDVGMANGDAERAQRSARRALELGARTTANHLRLAEALRAAARPADGQSAQAAAVDAEVDAAVDAALDGAQSVARDAADWALIGEYHRRHEDYPRAAAAYDEAARLAPASAPILYNRAAVRRFLGELDAAERDYDRVIELDPGDSEAWLNRSLLRTQTPERNHIEELERRLADAAQSWRSEVPIRYALAKEYEDLGEHPRSWEHLRSGAALRRRHLNYDVAKDLATVEWIIEAYPAPTAGARPADAADAAEAADAGDAGDAASAGGCEDPAPIFIVGLPRSGSTLLERIIGGHPEVLARGELVHYAAALVTAAVRAAGRRDLSRRELIAASAGVDYAALGADYLARVRQGGPRHDGRHHGGPRPARFTDKMPLNYLYCGSIARALPNARIVHMTRHPLASAYAMYKTLFNQGYPFSYDLAEIAEYIIGYRRLMDHWHRAWPGRILEVSYEQLVSDPEAEGRRVFQHLGLEWRPEFLGFHEHAAPTTTASAAQVRRPIYQSSIDLWKHHRQELEPVAARLRAAGLSV